MLVVVEKDLQFPIVTVIDQRDGIAGIDGIFFLELAFHHGVGRHDASLWQFGALCHRAVIAQPTMVSQGDGCAALHRLSRYHVHDAMIVGVGNGDIPPESAILSNGSMAVAEYLHTAVEDGIVADGQLAIPLHADISMVGKRDAATQHYFSLTVPAKTSPWKGLRQAIAKFYHTRRNTLCIKQYYPPNAINEGRK